MTDTPFSTRPRSKPPSMADIAGKIADKPSENFSTERLVGMTFNMPQAWHTSFKIAAAQQGITMRALLEECFNAYLREQGKR